MADWLARAAALRPDHAAVVADETLAYAQLDARASEVAARLAGRGVRPGDHVGLCGAPSAAWVAAFWGIARRGAVLVPLDPRLPPLALAERAAAARARLVLTAPGATPPEAAGFVALADPGPLGAFDPAPPRGLHSLVFTSGTEGRARAAMLTYENLAASAAQSALNLGVRPDDVWLAGVPLHHVGGLLVLVRCALQGCTVGLHPRFEPARVNEALDQGATLASMVPVQLRRVLDARGGRPFPATLRALLLGGDAAPSGLVEETRALGAPVLPTYGLTEACSQVACASPLRPAPAGSSGLPLPFTQVAIEDERGRPLGPGEVGEVVVRGPTVFAGYFADPEATARALRGGALRTGDLGRLDKDGFLWVAGRLGDRITTGGEKVDPAEVEAVLRAHPSVLDASVVGLPDAAWGQVVGAAIVPRPGYTLEEAALRDHVRGRLGPSRVPRRWRSVAELPRAASGKVLRGRVRELFGA